MSPYSLIKICRFCVAINMRIESVLSNDEVKGMEELDSITGYSRVQYR